MKTGQLAVALIGLVVVVGTVFGLVPGLLNANNTFINAVGVSVVLAVALAGILTVHGSTKRRK